MTQLEQLIKQQVAASVVASVSRTTDRVAEDMAQEILRDPAFRKEIQALIQGAFTETMAALKKPRRKTRLPR